MIHKTHAPADMHPALGAYSLGVSVDPGKRYLFVAGQPGVQKDGSVPDDIEAQIEVALNNVVSVLKDAGLGPEHLVKTTVLLTSRDYLPAFGKIRQKILGDAVPASTLVVVAGLAQPSFKIEIEAIAAV